MDGLQCNANQQDVSTGVYHRIYTKPKEGTIFISKPALKQTTEGMLLLTSVVETHNLYTGTGKYTQIYIYTWQ